MPENTITLDGRKFESVSEAMTAAQENYVTGYLGLAKANDLVPQMLVEYPNDLTRQELEREAAAKEFLHTILTSGYASYVMAGILTEAGKKWTHAAAEKNARAFQGITDAKEKRAMRSSLVLFVLFFFLSLGASSENSPKFSNPTGAAPDTSPEVPESTGVGTQS